MNVEVSTTIGSVTAAFSRTDLVRYAGASGDFNPIHYNDAAAAAQIGRASCRERVS
jgi:acyl dehydratase